MIEIAVADRGMIQACAAATCASDDCAEMAAAGTDIDQLAGPDHAAQAVCVLRLEHGLRPDLGLGRRGQTPGRRRRLRLRHCRLGPRRVTNGAADPGFRAADAGRCWVSTGSKRWRCDDATMSADL